MAGSGTGHEDNRACEVHILSRIVSDQSLKVSIDGVVAFDGFHAGIAMLALRSYVVSSSIVAVLYQCPKWMTMLLWPAGVEDQSGHCQSVYSCYVQESRMPQRLQPNRRGRIPVQLKMIRKAFR